MVEKTFLLEILTPEKTLFKAKVLSVQLPGVSGPFTLLYNHAPMIAILTNGMVKIIDSSLDKHNYSINEGVLEVKDNSVVVLTQSVV